MYRKHFSLRESYQTWDGLQANENKVKSEVLPENGINIEEITDDAVSKSQD